MVKNIILIGMPASGKSTVGVLLAKAVGMGFIDTDLVIQSMNGRLLQNMIDDDGIESFLKAEEAAAMSVVANNCVIATGGSMVYSARAMEHLRLNGVVVYLRVPEQELEKRLDNITTRGIAAAPGKTLRDIYDERTPLYERFADVTVDCGSGTSESDVESIIKSLTEYDK